MQKEIWVPISDYEGIYEVSNLGNFRRIAPAVGAKVGKILRGGTMERGYRTIQLCRSPKDHKCLKSSGLVAVAFLGNKPSPTHQVNHKNGIRNDDRAENLEWVTPSENVRHRFDVLRQQNPRGENHGNAILSDDDVSQIKALISLGASSGYIAKIFCVSLQAIKGIRGRHNWKHIAAADSLRDGLTPQSLEKPRGEQHHNSKVTPEIVRHIRSSSERGVDLALKYGVTPTLITNIRKHKIWRHVI